MSNKQIFDIIRKKNVALTPEEQVRQDFIRFLVEKYQYPLPYFSIESGMKVVDKNKRTDILVYDLSQKPFLLVECKAPSVKIDKNVFSQALQYNLKIQAPYIVVTNSKDTYCFVNLGEDSHFLQDIPQWNGSHNNKNTIKNV